MQMQNTFQARRAGSQQLHIRSHKPKYRSSMCLLAQAAANDSSTTAASPKPAKPTAAPAATKSFTNINRFVVPEHAQQLFIAEWKLRKEDMEQHPGFQGFEISSDGDSFTISSSWASIPDWESWSLSPACRRSHLPLGVFQSVPKKGEGFPEDFVPFVNYDEPVNAKY